MKNVIHDEILTTDECTFNEYLNPALQIVERNPLPFRRVSINTLGDSLKLHPVTGKAELQPHKIIGYNYLVGNMEVQLLKIYDLTEIVRHSSDPRFVEVCSRMGEGSHADVDGREIKDLVDTDASHSLNDFVKVYKSLSRYWKWEMHWKLRLELERNVIFIYAKDSARYIETQNLSVDNSDNQIHKTGNILGKLKVCIGARVMLTANINTSDHLMNASTGKIEYMQMPRVRNNLFDNVNTANSLKQTQF